MTTGRPAVLVIAALAGLMLVGLAVLAIFSVVPVVTALASALLALAIGVRLRGKSTRRRWRPRGPRPGAQRWPLAPAAPDQGWPTWTTSWPTTPSPQELSRVRQRLVTLLTEWEICGEAAQPTLSGSRTRPRCLTSGFRLLSRTR
jgi:hypothetical protein